MGQLKVMRVAVGKQNQSVVDQRSVAAIFVENLENMNKQRISSIVVSPQLTIAKKMAARTFFQNALQASSKNDCKKCQS